MIEIQTANYPQPVSGVSASSIMTQWFGFKRSSPALWVDSQLRRKVCVWVCACDAQSVMTVLYYIWLRTVLPTIGIIEIHHGYDQDSRSALVLCRMFRMEVTVKNLNMIVYNVRPVGLESTVTASSCGIVSLKLHICYQKDHALIPDFGRQVRSRMSKPGGFRWTQIANKKGVSWKNISIKKPRPRYLHDNRDACSHASSFRPFHGLRQHLPIRRRCKDHPQWFKDSIEQVHAR